MNKQEVIELFKSKGFQVDELLDDVAVSLNRPISEMEVIVASDYQIEDLQLFRLADNEIGIYIMDEDDDIPDCFGFTHSFTDIG